MKDQAEAAQIKADSQAGISGMAGMAGFGVDAYPSQKSTGEITLSTTKRPELGLRVFFFSGAHKDHIV